MSYKSNNRMLSLPAFLDSSCYSENYFLFSHQPRVPYAFESDDYVDINCEPSPRSLLSFSPMDSPQTHPILYASAAPASEGPRRRTRGNTLPLLAVRKPPRPALPRPLFLSAYAKPIQYNIYIELVLTPATLNAARASLTTTRGSPRPSQSFARKTVASLLIKLRTN